MASAQLESTPTRIDADTRKLAQTLYTNISLHVSSTAGDLPLRALTDLLQLSLNECLLYTVPVLPVPMVDEISKYLKLHEKKINGRGVNPLTAAPPKKRPLSPVKRNPKARITTVKPIVIDD